jgi:hypothetical protein
MSGHDRYGPNLQVAMFEVGLAPDPDEVASVADRARQLFAETR